MEKQNSKNLFKPLEYIYQDTEIHFLLNPNDDNVMVNATEMAKIFNRNTKYYLETKTTKELIKSFEKGVYDGEKEIIRGVKTAQIIQDRGRNGIYFHRELAIDFAGWLDVTFKRWILFVIDKIIFGNLKDYRDALKEEIEAKSKHDILKYNLQTNPCHETQKAYFDNINAISQAQSKKNKAVKLQKTLFEQDFVNKS